MCSFSLQSYTASFISIHQTITNNYYSWENKVGLNDRRRLRRTTVPFGFADRELHVHVICPGEVNFRGKDNFRIDEFSRGIYIVQTVDIGLDSSVISLVNRVAGVMGSIPGPTIYFYSTYPYSCFPTTTAFFSAFALFAYLSQLMNIFFL